MTAYVGDASINGRFFYDPEFTGFNFRAGKATLPQIFEKLAEPERDERMATIYVGSTPVDEWLPGFRSQNDVRLPADDALVSFWLGNRTRISAHYDFPDNLACVVSGQRRFTLFPPDQVGNLYVGPLDRTPSGQAISLVDFAAPDLQRFPKFADAIEHGQTAVLSPGDAVFIPSMWWHHIESMAPFNLLVNYWWCVTPAAMGSPSEALLHAILALRELPPRQRGSLPQPVRSLRVRCRRVNLRAYSRGRQGMARPARRDGGEAPARGAAQQAESLTRTSRVSGGKPCSTERFTRSWWPAAEPPAGWLPHRWRSSWAKPSTSPWWSPMRSAPWALARPPFPR